MKKFRAKLVLLLMAVFSVGVIVGVTGFAFSRGYMMRFIVNDVELSRDEYVALAYRAEADENVSIYCAQGEFSLSEGYVIYCFDTQEEVTAFMAR